MAERFFSTGVSTSELAAMGERRSALAELKRQKSFANKPKALGDFLREVWSTLEPFNKAGNTSIAQLPGLKPPGAAYAVYKALMENSKDFEKLVARHEPGGLKKVYLAAMYMTMRADDQGAIRNLQQMIRGLEFSKVSRHRKVIAEQPRSPFRAIVLRVLANNRFDTVEEIWTKLQGLIEEDLDIEFNGKTVAVDLEFFIDANETMNSYVKWGASDRSKRETFMRVSLDRMVSDLRKNHGLPKDI